jgi:hypothetical protein
LKSDFGSFFTDLGRFFYTGMRGIYVGFIIRFTGASIDSTSISCSDATLVYNYLSTNLEIIFFCLCETTDLALLAVYIGVRFSSVAAAEFA